MFSTGEQIRSRPYIHQSPKILQITNVSLSQIEVISSWFMFQYSIRSKKYSTVTLQPTRFDALFRYTDITTPSWPSDHISVHVSGAV